MGQLVLTLPKTTFPKICRFGTKEIPPSIILEPDGPKDSKARLLWIRGPYKTAASSKIL